MVNIIYALLWFALISGLLGLILAFASKVFFVKTDERIEKICELLPGANCGGCGYAGCSALAEAIVKGQAPTNACKSVPKEQNDKISAVMGVCPTQENIRYRAQVMCSGTHELAVKKYIYTGISDCTSASKLAGGDKLCPNGCIGLGTCAAACKFDAIHIINGVATIDYQKCTACGACVKSCPKSIIKLVPYDAKFWVGCSSSDKGAVTRSYCDIGCIGCKICEKNCSVGAIKVNNYIAEIDYSLCTGCGECEKHCPRKIIWSARSQSQDGIIRLKQDLSF